MTQALIQACLRDRAADLVHALGGSWHRDRGMCLCPAHADRSPSLSVRIGDRNLLFKCFAGCPTPDVLRAIRRRKLDIPTGASSDGRSSLPHVAEDANRARSVDLWERAEPIEESSAGDYLAMRGIRERPEALRFHARTPLGVGRMVQFRPALLAAVHERNRLVAIQRLFLDPSLRRLATDLGRPKRMLGRPLTGAVLLSRPGAILGLAEGVETALSAAELLGIPVWAALRSERLHRLAIPDRITRLILLPDADAAGRRAAARAHETYAAPARAIELLWPWGGLNDWNDVLNRPDLREGRERKEQMRLAA